MFRAMPPSCTYSVLITRSSRTDTRGIDQRFRLTLLRSGVHVLPDGRWYVGAVHSDAELPAIEAAIEETET